MAPHLRGRLLLLKNDVPGAIRSFEAALSRDARFFPAVASLASVDLAQGKPDAAKQRLETLLKSDPRNHQAMLLLAELHARTGGTPDEVLGRVREAIKLNPTVASLHVLLVDQFLNGADPRQALQAAQSAAAALPNDPSVLDALGRAQTAAGDGQQAVSTFRRLAAQQPDNPMVHVRLANAYNAARDLGSAERSLKKALEIQPDLLVAHRGLVAVALLQGRAQEGLELARALQKNQPRAADGFSLEGDVEVTRRNFGPAVAAYRAALQRAPSSDTAIKLHSALLGAGKPADAERWAATWLRDHPRDPTYLYFLGDVALSKKQYAEAEKRYREVLEVQPNNALAMNNVAWLMVRQGKPGALALAERANLLFPDRAPLLDTLAAALAADKQLKKAIEIQKRAVARDPQDPAVRLNLARLLVQDNQKSQARAELEALARLGDRFVEQAEVTAMLRSL
jgi:putative PEP-CTERM system TPR-repeat lipoprotein